jgi:hypothetical protein
MAAMFTQNIQKMVAHAANAYFEEEDIEMILKGAVHVHLSRFYPDFIQIFSRFFKNSLYPNFIQILS